MPGRSPRMIQRKRDQLDLTIINAEIQVKNHAFLKAISAAKRMPMSKYIDLLIERKREKHEKFIQTNDSSLSS